MTPANHWYTGINLSSLEFSTMPNASIIPDLSTTGADSKPAIDFLNQGANTIRIPVRWTYLQPYGYNADLNTPQISATFHDYFDNLVAPTIAAITSQNGYAILNYIVTCTIVKLVHKSQDVAALMVNAQMAP